MWEHEVINCREDGLMLCIRENEAKGWELLTALRFRYPGFKYINYQLFFKRPKRRSVEEENKARFILGLPPL